MHKNIDIRRFDVEKHETYAVRDMDTDEVLGLVFQDPEQPFSTLMTVKISEEIDEIDLFACAARIVEGRNASLSPEKTEVH